MKTVYDIHVHEVLSAYFHNLSRTAYENSLTFFLVFLTEIAYT